MYHKISFKSVKCHWLQASPRPTQFHPKGTLGQCWKNQRGVEDGSVVFKLGSGELDLECLWEKAREGGWTLVGWEGCQEYF